MIFTFPEPRHLGISLATLRQRHPLVHCITNQVASNLTANALLCVGASPLMAEDEDEVAALSPDALLINLGMQTPARMRSARVAVTGARQRGTPWVLDPVAAGALSSRTELALELAAFRPAVIKGNASEIITLAGGQGGRGTDATSPTSDAQASAEALARHTGAIIAITGPEDIVTDGHRTTIVTHGHPMLAKITGLGCMVGALIAACLTVETDALLAATNALTLLGLAAERAALRATGPGSLQVELLDELYKTGSGAWFS